MLETTTYCLRSLKIGMLLYNRDCGTDRKQD